MIRGATSGGNGGKVEDDWYVYNVHWFPKKNGYQSGSVDEHVIWKFQEPGSMQYKTIVDTVVSLEYSGHELTVAKFKLDDEGFVDDDTLILNPTLVPRE